MVNSGGKKLVSTIHDSPFTIHYGTAMMMDQKLNLSTRRQTRICAMAVAASLLIFIVLRARWIGHLLTWDEAMNLCAVRALATLSHDHFSNWFWRHPPLFSILTLLLLPLKYGFAERVEILALAFGILNIMLLFLLNRKIFGRTAAVLSVFFLAVMPGSMFFDVWVKRDHPVATFGLAAILLLVSKRPLWAGLCLGFAMLTKESAVFYAVAAGLLWLFGAAGKRDWKDLLALVITPLLASIWWYHLSTVSAEPGAEAATGLDRILGSATEHARLAMDADSGWGRPWHFYLKLLGPQLGYAGIGMAGIGAAVVVWAWRRMPDAAEARRSPEQTAVATTLERGGPPPHCLRTAMWWPLAVLVPSYLVLSLLKSKVPWVPMCMFPAWATLQGVALAWLLRPIPGTERVSVPAWLDKTRFTLAALLLVASLHYACTRDYDTMLEDIAPGQRRGARWSRNAAVAMNLAARDDERILLTSFHYWHGIAPGQACPVFAYYYTRPTPILMKPHETPFTDLVDGIKEHEIDWALLSPMPGDKEQEIFGGFVEELKLKPVKLERAWLFRTTKVRERK